MLIGIVAEPVIGVIGVVTFGGVALYTAVTLTGPRGLALTPTRIVVLGPGAGESRGTASRTSSSCTSASPSSSASRSRTSRSCAGAATAGSRA